MGRGKAVGLAFELAASERGRLAARGALGRLRSRCWLRRRVAGWGLLAGAAGCRLAEWCLIGVIGEPGIAG